jgi:hypothetical protein
VLARGLAELLTRVSVRADDLTAEVAGRRVAATSWTDLSGKVAATIHSILHQGAKKTPDAAPAPELEAAFGRLLPHRMSPRRFAHSPEFLLVDGSVGGGSGPYLRLYFRLADPGEAEPVWAGVLAELEGAAVPYRAKILTVGQAYPRNDAMVVRLGFGEPSVDADIVSWVVSHGEPNPGHSPFTRPLGPGVAMAWEPDDPRPGRPKRTFGRHRAAAVTEGIFDHQIVHAEATLAQSVANALTEAGCDPLAPERNVSSPADWLYVRTRSAGGGAVAKP